MTVVLGDVKWLVENFPHFDRNTEVVILVTNGSQVQELPIQSVTMENKLVFTCTLPVEVKDE